MDLISVHVEDMMTIEKHLKGEQFADLVEDISQLTFGEGVYQIGPTIISIPTEHFFDKEIDFKAYVPVSQEVEVEGSEFSWQNVLDIPKAISSEMKFNDQVSEEFRKLRQYLDDNNKPVPERIFLILTPVYTDYWVNIVVPLEDVVEE
ncbi:hypothetical protein NR996_01945 [Lactobacillus rodentium]|uniref:Uncharacterized protein n=1 Tax=Lactobacillus rodentium TaxID=947835 RepID=A0A2Z6T792_9LACO|nr:hypothetical protein [Lactobacillus rodentium]MCR1894174.1 hypothetical protein [Lactobacillus rodentium]GBG04471.1 hypothetical protein LrDSM24759_03850 [Lactobacillus rodentium]